MTSLARCSTAGKVIYWTERAAVKAVAVAEDRGELPPMRYYPCEHCGRWHLASRRVPLTIDGEEAHGLMVGGRRGVSARTCM